LHHFLQRDFLGDILCLSVSATCDESVRIPGSSGHDPTLTPEPMVHLYITLVLLAQEVKDYGLTFYHWCGSDRIQHLLLPGKM